MCQSTINNKRKFVLEADDHAETKWRKLSTMESCRKRKPQHNNDQQPHPKRFKMTLALVQYAWFMPNLKKLDNKRKRKWKTDCTERVILWKKWFYAGRYTDQSKATPPTTQKVPSSHKAVPTTSLPKNSSLSERKPKRNKINMDATTFWNKCLIDHLASSKIRGIDIRKTRLKILNKKNRFGLASVFEEDVVWRPMF